MASEKPYVAVVGGREPSRAELEAAEAVGRELALGGAIVVCGGLGGTMAAACRGAAAAGGLTIGILSGTDREEANEWVEVVIPTGLGELRNGLIVRAADVVIAVGGAYGTLSEIALALATHVPVIGVGTWEIDGIEAVETPVTAVRRALELIRGRGGERVGPGA